MAASNSKRSILATSNSSSTKKKKGSPGLFNGAPTEYLLVKLLSAEGDEVPVDRETKFFNGLVPLAEDLLVLVKLENAEKCDPLLDLLLLLLNSVEGSYNAIMGKEQKLCFLEFEEQDFVESPKLNNKLPLVGLILDTAGEVGLVLFELLGNTADSDASPSVF
ncbi:hypothetical protein G6F42_023328 [Rhizopus arrhizus]|nr:hypothetical protein G6F42_023328 [Rhizopus arrhizus]